MFSKYTHYKLYEEFFLKTAFWTLQELVDL